MRPAESDSGRRRRSPAAALLPAALLAAVAGVAGGLLRAGMDVPAHGAGWLAAATLDHAALMVCCFMGTIIGIERAVAVRLRAAWLAPLAAALAGLALLAGARVAGAGLLVLAALAFVPVNALLVRRQPAPHTWLLLGSALAWLAGNALFVAGVSGTAVLPWWFAFLVTTIAAERLEMTRLMRRRPGAQGGLYALLGALAAACTLGVWQPVAGNVAFGLVLLLLACWLLTFDIARRTLFTTGLPRYMAVCLLGGYAWLAVGGVAWAASALGLPARDAALHGIGLGFIVSMMMGHAPVILPAVARIKLQFGPFFYLPLALLHLSLVSRLGPGGFEPAWLARGAAWNAAALLLFVATVAGAAVAWRRRHGRREGGHREAARWTS